MRFSFVLVAFAVMAAGCAKAPVPAAPVSFVQAESIASATPTVRVGQIESMPVRCPCFRLEGTIGTQAWTLQFEQQGGEVAVDVFEVGGKKATAAQKKAIAQGIYAEAEEAMTQEAMGSAERARQLFAVAEALGVKGKAPGGKPTSDKPAFQVKAVDKLPVRCPCYQLTATLAGKDVEIEYEVMNGFAGPMHELKKVEVEGRKPTAAELSAIAAGLKTASDEAMKESRLKATLYAALAKALAR